MKALKIRLIFYAVLVVFGPVFAMAQVLGSDQNAEMVEKPSRILLIKLDSTVNPGSADFFITSLNRAQNSEFDALLIELDTPGGLVESTRDIVQAFLNSKIPVIVYVTPPGARAGSAGVMITMAAHVAVMAPGTNIGAAHPVAGGGEEIGEEMNKKITNDTAAWIEGIAEQRKRNKEWAVKAVRDSVSVTATQALKVNVIDFVADDLQDLLQKVDGREVILADKSVVNLKLAGAEIVRQEPGLKHRLLMRLADPNLAYILMVIGFLGIYAEFSHPGLIFPGALGGICFLLFLMSTQVLPINLVGIILIVAAMVMFVAEVKFTSYGALTAGGAVCLAMGSLFMFDVPEKVMESPDFSFAVSWALIIPTTAGFAIFAALIAFVVFRVQRKRPQTGQESLVGEIGTAATEFIGQAGQIKLQGVRWSAVSDSQISKGQKVRIIKIEQTTVTVEPVD